MIESQLALVEREIAQLEGLLEGDNLYKVHEPLYLEPTDLKEYHEQEEKHKAFAPRLKAYLSRVLASRHKQETALKQSYKKQYDVWVEGITKIEKERNERHLFEELPKHNHSVSLLGNSTHNISTTNNSITNPGQNIFGGSRSRSRSAMTLGGNGDVVRSEEELNQVLLSLIEQERENPATRWMSTLAIIPPQLKLAEDVEGDFKDENMLIRDVTSLYPCLPTVDYMTDDGKAWCPTWSQEEELIFVDKFLHYPKNFQKIASFLPADKTRGACVQFYYRNKKRLRLKQKLQAHRRNPGTSTHALGGESQLGPVVKKRVGRPPRAQLQQQQQASIHPIDEEDEMAIVSDA